MGTLQKQGIITKKDAVDEVVNTFTNYKETGLSQKAASAGLGDGNEAVKAVDEVVSGLV